jgi:hypothetical protein
MMQDRMGQCYTVMAMTILAGKSGAESFLPSSRRVFTAEGGGSWTRGLVAEVLGPYRGPLQPRL